MAAPKKRRSLLRIAAFAFGALVVISALPLVVFYLRPIEIPQKTNETAITALKQVTGDRFAFIVIGDPENGLFMSDASTLKIIANINREDRFKKTPIACVITAGDNVFRGTAADYRHFRKIFSLIKFPVVCTPGNHDYDDDGKERYLEYCGAPRTAFPVANSYFIILDNADGEFPEDQFAWFEKELETGMKYTHRFVFLHKPPVNPYQQSWYRMETNPWPRRFMKLCEQYKVDIVFAGHEHMFKEMEFGGVKYLVTGGGGILPTVPSWDGGYIHYVVVNVNGDYVSYEVRKVAPPLWLRATYYFWKDLLYRAKALVT